MYTHTERKVVNDETMELMRHLSQREYQVCVYKCVCVCVRACVHVCVLDASHVT